MGCVGCSLIICEKGGGWGCGIDGCIRGFYKNEERARWSLGKIVGVVKGKMKEILWGGKAVELADGHVDLGYCVAGNDAALWEVSVT